MLAEAEKGSSGRILNLLDFPAASSDNFFPRDLATDVHALVQVLGNWTEKYPFSVMRWGLCATADAVHDCHIDAEGFATACSVLSGEKYWLVALPPDMDFGGFASAATYLESYDEYMQNDQGWVIVALKLTPGTTL